MPSSIPISFPRRKNPQPAPDVNPLPLLSITATVKSESKTQIKDKWEAMTDETREYVLRYFNTIPGKFTLTEEQINEYKSQDTLTSLPEDMREPVRFAVVGWEWDYVMREITEAIQIAFGLGGITLSEAGTMGIQTFSELPPAFRKQIVEAFSIWPTAKAASVARLTGVQMQTTVAETVRARRHYQPWRDAIAAMKEPEKYFLFNGIDNLDNLTEVLPESLAKRDFDHLPEDLQRYLHDFVPTTNINAIIEMGKYEFYKEQEIICQHGRAKTVWVGDPIRQFIKVVDMWWNLSSSSDRATILKFIMDNDELWTVGAWSGAVRPYTSNQIRELSSFPTLYEVRRSNLLPSNYFSYFIGQLAFYLTWLHIHSGREGELKNTLVGLDLAQNGRVFGAAPAVNTPERMDRIDEIVNGMWTSYLSNSNLGESYKGWCEDVGTRNIIASLTLYTTSIRGAELRTAGENLYNRIRENQRLIERARFHVGDSVRMTAQLGHAVVDAVSGNGTEIRYNIHFTRRYPIGQDPFGSERTGDALTNVVEEALSKFEPWTLADWFSGRVWASMGLGSKKAWLLILRNQRMSSDQSGLPTEYTQLAARDWEHLGDVIRKKLFVIVAHANLLSEIRWFVGQGGAGGPQSIFGYSWQNINEAERIGFILKAMDLKYDNKPLIVPSNEARFRQLATTFDDLPLDFIFGMTLAHKDGYNFRGTSGPWGAGFNTLSDALTRMEVEKRIYYGIGAGLEPSVAVALTRPEFHPLPQQAEWKVFMLIKAFVDRTEGITERINAVVARGRELAPTLPSVPVTEELNTAWRALNYPDRYRCVISGIGGVDVQAGYSANSYHPPASYVQAASVNNINSIQDANILQALIRKFEASNRNAATMTSDGESILTAMTMQLNASRQGATDRESVAVQEKWDALKPEQRSMLARYLHDEVNSARIQPDERRDWAGLQIDPRGILRESVNNFPEYMKMGAAILFEEMWQNSSQRLRNAVILGCGVAMNSIEFRAVMEGRWIAYDDITSRFTARIIDNMVDGLTSTGPWGQDATKRMVEIGLAMHPSYSGTPTPLPNIFVGDLISVELSVTERKYGVVLYIDKPGHLDIHGTHIPADRDYFNHWAQWEDNIFDAFDRAMELNAPTIKRRLAEGAITDIALTYDPPLPIRYEGAITLPVFKDDWGGALIDAAAREKRAERLTDMVERMDLGMSAILLTHLYPEANENAISNFDSRSGWTNLLKLFGSYLVGSCMAEAEGRTTGRELVETYDLAGPMNKETALNYLNTYIPGTNWAETISHPEQWSPIIGPIVAYAIKKGIMQGGEAPPAGTEALIPFEAVAPEEIPVVPVVPPAEAPPTPGRARGRARRVRRAVARPPPAEVVPPRPRASLVGEAWTHTSTTPSQHILDYLGFARRQGVRGDTSWADLPADVQESLMSSYEVQWNEQGIIEPTPQVEAPPTPTPTPAPRRARRPARPVKPAPGEDVFVDPFDVPVRAVYQGRYEQAERNQIVANIRDINTIKTAIGNANVPYYLSPEGGAHGIPVQFAIFPLTPANVEAIERITPSIRSHRVWIRIRNPVINHDQLVVNTLQTAEFYKNGRWYRENITRRKIKKNAMSSLITFDGELSENPSSVPFQFIRFREDAFPIGVIKNFLEAHGSGWVTGFSRHYNMDRLPRNQRIYVAVSEAPQDRDKPFNDRIIGVMGITQNSYDNIEDVFIAIHNDYRQKGVAADMNRRMFEIAKVWTNPQTNRGARRVYAKVKDANISSKAMMESVGFVLHSQFYNEEGELVNKYMKELYTPRRENP